MKGRILLCVLDWGLGHATRSLALARTLQAEQYEVVFASSGLALDLLKLELPDAKFHVLPSHLITYPREGSFAWSLIMQSRKIRKVIEQEHGMIKEILREEKFDAIISDNRYGCYHPGVRSIFISHHLKIRLPGGWKVLSWLVNFGHRRRINRFDECWIPDFPDRKLSGDLSRLEVRKKTFIGPLSTMKQSSPQPKKRYSLLAVLSGPEPQRTLFAEALMEQMETVDVSWLLVHGMPGSAPPEDKRQLSFMSRDELNRGIEESELVICRSGYSSIMDLATLGSKALLIPTPGQTEQLYLAEQLMEKGICFCQQQDKLDLRAAMHASKGFSGFSAAEDSADLLIRAIQTLSYKR
jgi:uncharacterized protein (TIGR00661 family)